MLRALNRFKFYQIQIILNDKGMSLLKKPFMDEPDRYIWVKLVHTHILLPSFLKFPSLSELKELFSNYSI